MGDRGNIVMRFHEESGNNDTKTTDIYFYTHWRGSSLLKIVQSALRRGWRWDDDAYLARIIFNDLQGDDRGETGFGIAPFECDNEHPLVVVDTFKKRVERDGESWPFEVFVKMDVDKLLKDRDD